MTKKGRIGKDEKTRIVSYLDTETNEQIADRFDRTLKSVVQIRAEQKALVENPLPDTDNDYVATLHTRHFWPTIKRQLMDACEITYFEQSWASLYEQYIGNEVKHTDEMMIKDLITLDIQLNRILEDRRNMAVEGADLRKMLDDAKRIELEPERVERVSTLSRALTQVVAVQETSNKLSNDLQTKKDKKFEQLKATRDQRFKTSEQSRTNFFERVKFLDETAQRKSQGRKNELIRMSAAIHQAKLESPHHFDDGEWERPILTPESVLGENYAEPQPEEEVSSSQDTQDTDNAGQD